MTTLAWSERLVDRLRGSIGLPSPGAAGARGRRARLVASIEDPYPGEPSRADELLHGRYRFLGEERGARGSPPWRVADASPAWWAEAEAFDWLRDFRAHGSAAAGRKARDLCQSWFEARHPDIAWRPDVLGRRIAAWLAHAGFLLRDADARFHGAFLASLGAQVRRLERTAPRAPDGAGRLAAGAALVLAGLALARAERCQARGLRLLESEIRRQILSDGGHVSRNPSTLLFAFAELVRAQSAHRALGREVPSFLGHAVERIAPMLRLLRHGDGGLALFNGGAEESALVIDTLLGEAKVDRAPFVSAPHGGYERLRAERLVLCLDAGAPPPRPFDHDAHAGVASFELSVGRERLVVNCGAAPTHNREWWAASRASAAHSALVIDDTNAIGLAPNGGVNRRPAPPRVHRRDTEDGSAIEIDHDGYRELFDIQHSRALALAADGASIEGEDRLSGGRTKPYTVRFHLHPRVSASLVRDGRAALLRLGEGAGWVFATEDGRLGLEDSVYLGERGETWRGEQLVINATHTGGASQVRWRFDRSS